MSPHHAEQTDEQDGRLASTAEAPAHSILQPSVVAVQGCAPSQECWLMSSGHGDILLIKSSNAPGMNLHHSVTTHTAKPYLIQYLPDLLIKLLIYRVMGCHPSSPVAVLIPILTLLYDHEGVHTLTYKHAATAGPCFPLQPAANNAHSLHLEAAFQNLAGKHAKAPAGVWSKHVGDIKPLLHLKVPQSECITRPVYYLHARLQILSHLMGHDRASPGSGVGNKRKTWQGAS